MNQDQKGALAARGLFCCILLVAGCNSEKRAAEVAASNEAYAEKVRREIAEIEVAIAKVEVKQKALDRELERRETSWRSSVLARHPDWEPKERERQLAILESKWNNSNRDKDQDTYDNMKRSGWLVHQSKLVEDDYWDIIRARRYLLMESPDIAKGIYDERQPLQDKRNMLVQRLKQIESPPR